VADTDTTSAPPPHHALPVVCTCILGILVVAALSLAREVLIPLALAVLLTFILTPFVVRLQRYHVGRIPAVLLVSLLALVVIGGFTVLILLQVRSLVADLPKYRTNIIAKVHALRGAAPRNLLENIEGAVNDVHNALAGPSAPEQPARPVPVSVQPSGPARFTAVVGPAAALLTQFLFVAALVMFMLARHEDVRDRLIRLVGHGRLTDATRALEDASRRVSRFLFTQLFINSCFGLLLGLGLFLIGLPQPLLWGLLVGALRFIPYVGSPVGGLLLLLLSIAIFPTWSGPVGVAVLFLMLEVLAANVIEPLLFGHSTGVSPVALLFAAAFWAWLWGPVGLLLSTPLTVCLVVVGRHVPGLGFFGVLLGDEPPLSPEKRYYQRLLAKDPDEAIDLIEEYLQSHPRDTFYDRVLLPALVLARRDHDRGVLPLAEKQGILRDMRAILEEVVPVQCPPQETVQAEGRPVVFGIPAGEGDELALYMLRQLLETEGCRLEVLPAGTRAAEVVGRVAGDRPAGVIIAALPPQGVADTRYLCKRLRGRFPELTILVGRWGQKDDLEQMRQRLKAAGASDVGVTLLESRVQVLPLLEGPAPVSKARQPAAV
jgi:predicted PurR-regulated permease PerM